MSENTREALAAFADRGGQKDFLFFWGHTPPPGAPTAIGPWVLSQWYPAPLRLDDQDYATAEHWMMAEKARLCGDVKIIEKILAAPTPAEAKALGRRIKHFDEDLWVEHRLAIVERGNLARFTQHPALGAYLVGTGTRILVEASPHDRIWGIGLGEADPRARDPRRWLGDNLLGLVLMRVRTTLAASPG